MSAPSELTKNLDKFFNVNFYNFTFLISDLYLYVDGGDIGDLQVTSRYWRFKYRKKYYIQSAV